MEYNSPRIGYIEEALNRLSNGDKINGVAGGLQLLIFYDNELGEAP